MFRWRAFVKAIKYWHEGTGLVGNNETSSYSHKYIFFHISYAIYQTHDWYPWIVFNPLMILVLSEPVRWNIKYICEIYVQIYYGNFKSDTCIAIHAKCTIWTVSTWNLIHISVHGLWINRTRHVSKVYCPSFIKTGWLISTDSIDLVGNYHDDVTTWEEKCVYISGNYIHTSFKYKSINNYPLDIL